MYVTFKKRYSVAMSFLLPLIFLLCIHHWNDRGAYAREIFYQDILDIDNDSCYPLDSSQEPRQDDPVDNYELCRCHSQWWENGTCCNDYRGYPTNQKCVSNELEKVGLGYYAISVCPDNTPADSVWKIPCETEWNGENDVLMVSPVTSLATSKTYKNYYCFKCHETTDEYVSFNLLIYNNYKIPDEKPDYRVEYDSVRKTWTAIQDNPVPIPVKISFLSPVDVWKQPPLKCELAVITDCAASWTDALIRDKCLSYTAVVESKPPYTEHAPYTQYKNVHCALCNYETLDSFQCKEPLPGGLGPVDGKGFFSISSLLNINNDRFVKAGSDGKCKKDHLWDPYGKKCRKQSCVLPGYVIKDNRCVPP